MKKNVNTDSRFWKNKVRMGDPLCRMRSERRLALVFFNLLLLAAVLMQLLGYALQGRHDAAALDLPPVQMESASE